MWRMKVISQRELRNDNAKIVRSVEEGETYTVTRRGVPVAQLGPIPKDPGERPARPALRRITFASLKRVRADVSTADLLDDLRGDR